MSLCLGALVWCVLASGAASAQEPAEEGVSYEDDVVVFRAAGTPQPQPTTQPTATKPAAKPAAKAASKSESLPGSRIDPGALAEAFSNSVVNSGDAWDPSLGSFTTGRPEIDQIVLESSTRYGVDPKLVVAVMHQESGFKQRAVSPKGASGYMQLMPATARRLGVTNIFDPRQNIDAGTKYLRMLLDLFDDNVELALAGYNAGEYRVIRNGYRIPQIRETQNYVRTITARYRARAGRGYRVTFGPGVMTARDRDVAVKQALETTDDRGDAVLTNNY